MFYEVLYCSQNVSAYYNDFSLQVNDPVKEGVQKMMADTVAKFGRIDSLVKSA